MFWYFRILLLCGIYVCMLAQQTNVEESQYKIPLRRQEKYPNKTQNLQMYLDQVDPNIPLKNYQNLQYVGPISVGSPSQEMTAIYDTGSTVLWVPTTRCIQYGCHNTVYFNVSQSSSVTQSEVIMSLQYGQGKATGIVGSDYVKLSGTNINVIVPILFVFTDQDMDGMLASGIFGLSNERGRGSQNFLEAAVQNKQLSDSLFAFEIKPMNETSFFHFGSISQSILNNTFWVKANRDNYWTFKIIDIFKNGESYFSGSFDSALVDSGTSALVLPQDLFSASMNDLVQVCRKSYLYGYLCPCNPTESQKKYYPYFTLYGEGMILEIPYNSYLLPVPGESGSCQLLLSYMPSGTTTPFMILGDVFMRQYIVTFDKSNNEIGFTNVDILGTVTLQSEYITMFIVDGFLACSIIAFFVVLYKNSGKALHTI